MTNSERFQSELVTQLRLLQMAGTIAQFDAADFAARWIRDVQNDSGFSIGPAAVATCKALGVSATFLGIRAYINGGR